MSDLYLPQLSTSFQDSRASWLKTQKNKKMKNPWKELKIVKRTWNGTLISLMVTVRAAKSQVIPNKNIIPETLIIRRTTVCNDIESFFRANVPRVCLISMAMMMMKTTTLMRMMAKIGPKKATKKTIGLLRKQLQERNHVLTMTV